MSGGGAAAVLEDLSSLCGDADRCGVIISGAGRLNCGTLVIELFPSLDCVAAGVRGGEWTVELGGESLGDGSPEPAGKCRLFGVVLPD